ncbi:HD domain-containing protein [Tsukamurella sp. DT100]|uniref:HD domain-containing protein n=1 Tax=Tsukamurella sp. DT100 TaxID=3393415 RepID=UPI003CF12EA4
MTIDAIADSLAEAAHAGQTDKAGNDYITHPRRVAGLVTPQTAENRAAALLHDVLEDTSVTAHELASAGIPAPVVRAVDLLTRRADVPSEAYYAAIRADPIALAVKRADIADNTDPQRLALLDPATQERLRAKYAAAIAALETPAGG